MVPTFKEIGRRSRTCQKGSWGRSAALFTLSVSLPLSFGILNAVAQLLFERPQVSGTLYAFWPRLPGIFSASIALSLAICALLALAPLRMGCRAWYYGGTIRSSRSRKWVTFWYKPTQAFHAAHISISLAVRKLAWALFLLLPGALLCAGALYISSREGLETRMFAVLLGGAGLLMLCGFFAWLCVIQRYALVPWMAVRYPKISVKKLLVKSKACMEGRYGYSLRMALRMLPFAPLAMLGAPLLWIVPYAWQRRAVWAQALIEGVRCGHFLTAIANSYD
ncbi:MAG: hypothetical protein LBJ12_05280 [Oscillospiraceae bacterium]|jgi:hypothetical protein|nr:hypothetical protein [Oscillospiraceae bacterium]